MPHVLRHFLRLTPTHETIIILTDYGRISATKKECEFRLDPHVTLLWISIIVLLLLSAFFSSAETAFQSANHLRLRSLSDDGNERAKRVLKLLDRQSKLLSCILIGNNIVNLSASALSTTLAQSLWGNAYISLATGVLTFVVIIFGEILPKTVATLYAEPISMVYAPIFLGLCWIMTPLIVIVNLFSGLFLKLFRLNRKKQAMTEEEFLTAVSVSEEEGVLENNEREMITNVVDFGDSLAKDIMVPRIDVTLLEAGMSYDEVTAVFRDSNFSRLPVYSGNVEHIIGIVFLKDLFHYSGSKEDFTPEKVMRKPYFTFAYKKTSELLSDLRKSSGTIAVVLDEYGAMVGIITLEDLLEEIVGEIRDEYDSDERDGIVTVNDREYLLSGSVRLEDLSELIGTDITSEDYDSVAGHVLHLLEHLPAEGETVSENGITYTVEAMDKNRIETVRVSLPASTDD